MKYIVITGVSAGDGQNPQELEAQTHQVREDFCRIMDADPLDVIVFNPEQYFDRSHAAGWSRFLIRAGAAYLQARYGDDFKVLAEKAGDKAMDVWLYLNPFWHRTRNQIDDAVGFLFRQFPDAEVYAHSLGSVIAFRALKISKSGYTRIRLHTMGSPLWMKLVQHFLDVELDGLVTVADWKNYWSSRDVIGLRPIPEKLGIEPGDQRDVMTPHDLNETLVAIRRWARIE